VRARPSPPTPLTPFDVAFGVVLFAIAFVLRNEIARVFAAEPVWDGHYYDFGAKRIAAGFGYSADVPVNGVVEWHAWCHYPVGYSAFLGVFYKLFGAHLEVARVANALVGAALGPATWLVARHAFGATRARIAAAIVAFHPGLILYSSLVMSEELAALTTLLSFWVALAAKNPRRGVVYGALGLGVSALVRPQALLCAPFLLYVLHDSWPGAKKALVHAAAVCAIALVPVLPWTARNCAVMDSCALVSTNGGWNLAIGAFPRATGRFETLRSSDGCREVTGQVQQDRCWFSYGIGQIAAHPVHWLALVPKKLGYTFDHESFAVGYLHEARPDQWPVDRAVEVRGALTLLFSLLVGFSVLGCVTIGGRRRRANPVQIGIAFGSAIFWIVLLSLDEPHLWPIAMLVAILPFVKLPGAPAFPPALKLAAALLATTALTHAVFFGEDRYHVVTIPVFCIFLAGALRRPDAGDDDVRDEARDETPPHVDAQNENGAPD
jgi:4-amino-4-deoxy-L-arabinose transferase-like glycosyltransferase